MTSSDHWRTLRPHEWVNSSGWWPVGGGAARPWELREAEQGQMVLPFCPRPCWRFELERERNAATYEPNFKKNWANCKHSWLIKMIYFIKNTQDIWDYMFPDSVEKKQKTEIHILIKGNLSVSVYWASVWLD